MRNGWITDRLGDKRHYVNDLLHNDNDEPACIWANGLKFWCKNGELHRINGPAVIFVNGYKEYWIDGKKLSKEQFDKQYSEAKAEEAPTNNNYPHVCPDCKSPAYISFLNKIDCSNCKGI